MLIKIKLYFFYKIIINIITLININKNFINNNVNKIIII